MEKHDLIYDLKEAVERHQLSLDDLEPLRKVLGPEIPKDLTDKQLALFLNACDGIEDAARVLKIYYDARRNTPEHFNNRDPLDVTIQQCFENQKYAVLPPTLKEGCPIVYHKISNPQASNYFFDHAIKTYCMTMDMALYKYGPRPGVIFIYDMDNVGFSHMLRASISSIRRYLHYLQYGLPANMCRIHVVNVIPLFNKILTLLKPFLKKELIEIIHVHRSDMDYEEFYKEFIPKSHLPADYGGELNSVDELNEEMQKEMIKAREYFLAEEKQRLRTINE